MGITPRGPSALPETCAGATNSRSGDIRAETYVATLGTLKTGRAVVRDRVARTNGAPCNPDVISIALTGGSSDTEQRAAIDQQKREKDAAEAKAKQQVEEQERKDAEDERHRVAVQRSAVARARAKEEADEKARAAYLAKFPILQNGAEVIFIGSDRKCSEQFVQAMGMDGLEKRKRLAELVSYGCGFTDPRGLHVRRVQGDGAYCQIAMIEGKHQSESGWVPCSWVR